jgi:hypothetical protein
MSFWDKILPWRWGRKAAEPDEDYRTPHANRLRRMLKGGWSLDAILLELEHSEIDQWNMRAHLDDLHRQAATNAAVVHKARTVTRKRNHRNHQPKRNRAGYMRKYRRKRSGLRLVTRDGDDVA